MRHLAKISVISIAILHCSCSSTEKTTTEDSEESSWVADAQKRAEQSQKETERQLALLRVNAKGVDSFAHNEKWELYRVGEQVYGVRTEAGKVTGELITEDAKIVGRWVRAYGDLRTSGGGFTIIEAVSEDYADVQ